MTTAEVSPEEFWNEVLDQIREGHWFVEQDNLGQEYIIDKDGYVIIEPLNEIIFVAERQI